jgi:hypothetical protein
VTIRGPTVLTITAEFRRLGQQAHPDPVKWLRTLQDAENYLDYLAEAGRIDVGEAFLQETADGFNAEIEANKRKTRYRIVTVVVTMGATMVACGARIWASMFI